MTFSFTGVAMLDFDELQEFPKISSWATKSDFISDVMGTQSHQKTLYESWLQGSLCMGIWWQVDYLPLYVSLPIRYSFLPSLPRITRLRPEYLQCYNHTG